MPLPSWLEDQLALPAICAPMFIVSNPTLVGAACAAGLVGGLPRHNVRSLDEFDAWLGEIGDIVARRRDVDPAARVGPVAVNLSTLSAPDVLREELAVCRKRGVRLVISSAGHPGELIARAHDAGMQVYHDVTSVRFAEKAIAAGADGLIAIGAGGGGQAGVVSHLVLIPKLRAMFDGVIVMAGGVAHGAAIRAGQALGADLAYLGTRFIVTRESPAEQAYKDMIVDAGSADLAYTHKVNGVPASWLQASLDRMGVDLSATMEPKGPRSREHLPAGASPWKTIWSAGQAVDLIEDIPSVAEVVDRLHAEYRRAGRRA